MIAHGERRPVLGGVVAALRRSPRLRPLRFLLTGGTAGALQLVVLRLLEAVGATPLAANAAGFLLSAQVNFACSYLFTWADRRPAAGTGGRAATPGQRWLQFHGAIAGTALLNLAVFALARHATPDLAASALGIVVAGVANFLLGDRLVFRRPGSADRPVVAHGRPVRLRRGRVGRGVALRRVAARWVAARRLVNLGRRRVTAAGGGWHGRR